MMEPIHFITDRYATMPVVDQALAAARGGADIVQFRDKVAADAEFSETAKVLLAVLTPLGVRLIINDRIDVACQIGADGLHMGQGDGDVERCRALLGPGKLLGLSIENADQLQAVSPGVDYFGVGPVRATATKPGHAPPIGFEGLGHIISQTRIPCVAIGGLGQGDLGKLRALGAAGVAIVSAISRAADPQQATRELLNEWNRS